MDAGALYAEKTIFGGANDPFPTILSSKMKYVFCSGCRKDGVTVASFDEKKANRSILRVSYAKKYERFKLTGNSYASNWPARNVRKKVYAWNPICFLRTGQSLEYRMKTMRYAKLLYGIDPFGWHARWSKLAEETEKPAIPRFALINLPILLWDSDRRFCLEQTDMNVRPWEMWSQPYSTILLTRWKNWNCFPPKKPWM